MGYQNNAYGDVIGISESNDLHYEYRAFFLM